MSWNNKEEIETICNTVQQWTRHFFTMFTIVKSRGSSFSDYRVFTCLRTEGPNDCINPL